MSLSIISDNMPEKPSKKARIIEMAKQTNDIQLIAKTLNTTPSYVKTIIRRASAAPKNAVSFRQEELSLMFDGILKFKTLELARKSVNRLDELYHSGDNTVKGLALFVALTGFNRATTISKNRRLSREGRIKFEKIASLFQKWIEEHKL
ncbi:MAG: hypothetical protein QXJ68_00100 [Methanocellales archaeon]